MNKILYIEDEPSFQALVTIMLDRAEFEVDVASSGEEGRVKATSARYDLILMDLCMPGIDGFEVTRRLKHTDMYNSVPIVAVTGLTSPDDVKRAYSAGICDYIAKPFKRNQLLDMVYKHLSLAACEEW